MSCADSPVVGVRTRWDRRTSGGELVTEGRSGIFFYSVQSDRNYYDRGPGAFFSETSFHVCVYMNELCFAEKRVRYADINNRDGRPFRCGRNKLNNRAPRWELPALEPCRERIAHRLTALYRTEHSIAQKQLRAKDPSCRIFFFSRLRKSCI